MSILLKSGDQGENVTRLQVALGFSEAETDGIFGPNTDAAVRDFQQRHNLGVDGIAGPVTLRALGLDPDTLQVLQSASGDTASTGADPSGSANGQQSLQIDQQRGPFVVVSDGGGVNLPSIDDHSAERVQVWLNAEDSITYTRADLQQIYVDNHITTFAIQPDPLTLNVDDQTLTLNYENGEQYQLVLGSILESGPSVSKYFQALSQLVVAADNDLTPLFNAQTTPNLLALRHRLNQLMVQAKQQRIEIGSIVYSFARIINSLANQDMSDVLKLLKEQG